MQIIHKKTLHQYALYLLTIGASATLGFLSFGGMLALWPSLPLAFGAFALSVAYEGEIYIQTIRSSLKKIFDPNFITYRRGKNYLLKHLSDHLKDAASPEFFKTYKKQCDTVIRSKHDIKARETLSHMEEAFARLLVGEGKNYTGILSEYQKELTDLENWIKENVHKDELRGLESQKNTWFNLKLLSALAAVFMGMGSVYLLAEAFAVIPFMAVVPFVVAAPLVVSLSILSGLAYGLLTFNAMTNLYEQYERGLLELKLIKNLKDDLSYGESWAERLRAGVWWRGVAVALGSLLLVVLAGVLTVCTAGTWMTVVKESKPLFGFMTKLPAWVMGVVNPIITGISSFVFNLLNTVGSLEEIDELARSEKTFLHRWRAIKTHIMDNETMLQRMNPVRILLTFIIIPMRVLLFLGHLFAIGLTADRVPGWSQFKSALVGFVCEFFEDLHFFVDHDDEESVGFASEGEPDDEKKFIAFIEARLGREPDHAHGHDLPTQLLMYGLYFSGMYWLAVKWDVWASKKNEDTSKHLTDEQAWEKQWNKPWGYKLPAVNSNLSQKESSSVEEPKVSSLWFMENALYKIKPHQKEYAAGYFIGANEQKIKELEQLQQDNLKKNDVDEPVRAYI